MPSPSLKMTAPRNEQGQCQAWGREKGESVQRVTRVVRKLGRARPSGFLKPGFKASNGRQILLVEAKGSKVVIASAMNESVK
jgi:hypothetical protein